MESIDRLEAYLKIKETKGKIFSVEFIKKDESIRKMNCRLGVRKGITGKGMKYSPEAKRLITVFDMQKKEYRLVNMKTMFRLHINKETYNII